MLLNAIRPVFDHPGPFVTVEADVGRPDEHAPDAVDTRWTSLRHRLEHLGVGAALVEDVHDRVTALPPMPGEARRTLVLDADSVLFDDTRAGAGTEPVRAERSALPDLTPWLVARDAEIPFLLVRADRTGADMDLYRTCGRPSTDHRSVTGETFQITKVPEGDWAQMQYQRRAEGLWGRNAAEVAEVMTEVARGEHPAAVLVAGDDHAVELIEHEWDPQLAPLVKVDSGGRAAGSDSTAFDAEVEEVLAEFAAHADHDVAEHLAEGAAHDRAVAGLAEVIDALVKGQAETVVIDPARSASVHVRPADHPGLNLPAEARRSEELPADRVVTALTALTDAEVRVVDGSLLPRDGMSAILRWSDA